MSSTRKPAHGNEIIKDDLNHSTIAKAVAALFVTLVLIVTFTIGMAIISMIIQ